MNPTRRLLIAMVAMVAVAGSLRLMQPGEPEWTEPPAGRKIVTFWHFWGGEDRDVVDSVARRFNASQDEYFVKAIAIPGNNLQAKLFLSIAGGDPPDLVNQDDPVIADWALRGLIRPIDSLLDAADRKRLTTFLFPSAQRLGEFDGNVYGICNGLDIRALYYNKTALADRGLAAPTTPLDLRRIAEAFHDPDAADTGITTFGYLPDSRRIWAWGYVFGGQFFDARGRSPDKTLPGPTLTDPAIVAAARWMQGFAKAYGADLLNRFRAGDQSLPGKTFPLLPVTDEEQIGRYAVVMDGQWRTRDIRKFLQRRTKEGIAAPEFGVCPLPAPPGGKTDAGWVNGNFFIVPSNAKCPDGAIAFARFWIGMDDPDEAAETCVAGGWIPVSEEVVATDRFQEYLAEDPLFAEFVRLAGSPNQFPIPVVPGASALKRAVEQAGARLLSHPDETPEAILREAGEAWLRSRVREELP